MGGRFPGCFFRVLLKRSIPKPDEHRKDIIQQELLGTDVFNIGIEEQQLHKISHCTDKQVLWWLVSFHPVLGTSIITFFPILGRR